MKRVGVFAVGLSALAVSLLLGGCSPGTADCDANTVLVTIKCGEAIFSGGHLEITRPSDGKEYSKSTTFECPGEDYVFKLAVADYKKGDKYSLRFTPAITGAAPFTKDEDAVGACLPWTVVLPAFTQGSPGVDAAVTPAPSDAASATEEEAGTPSLPGDNKENSARCGAAAECKSGFCADGVCCDSECVGACKACNLTASPGICSNVAKGTKPTDPMECDATEASTCGLDGTCDGAGACAKYPDGTLCQSGTCSGVNIVGRKECQAGNCTSAPERSCVPFACNPNGVKCFAECTNNDQCAAGKACDAQKSCGKKPIGASCQADAECGSEKCADGFCCDAACKGACEGCGLAGKEGRCTAIAKGVKDPRGVCKETDISACGTTGTCDGARGCSSYEANAVCKAASCSGTTFSATAKCDGVGSCVQSTAPCGAFACTTNGCKTACNGDADCVGGTICKGTQCVAKAGNGNSCSGNAECTSGFCADNVCCNAPCDGACKSCANAAGTCSDITGEDPGMCSGVRRCSNGCKSNDGQQCNAPGDCVSGVCATYYRDGDGDRVGQLEGEKFCGTAPPSNYVRETGDCCDKDAEVPFQNGVRQSVPQNRKTACGTGDFNCDKVVETWVLADPNSSSSQLKHANLILEQSCTGLPAMGKPCDTTITGFLAKDVTEASCGTPVRENICSGPNFSCSLYPRWGTDYKLYLQCL